MRIMASNCLFNLDCVTIDLLITGARHLVEYSPSTVQALALACLEGHVERRTRLLRVRPPSLLLRGHCRHVGHVEQLCEVVDKNN